ncbi:MAG: cytochrome-c peroxidase [Actinomycetota bacterium]|nr:MAG: cytochrome-c peroxidase [Actinomycetota bacterium]
MIARSLVLLVVVMLAAAVVVPAAGAAATIESVGRQIFFDTDLSWPRGQSCASCHDPGSGFADPEIILPVSEGAILGRFGARNAPSAAYASFTPVRSYDETLGTFVGGQFLDGRAATLEEQAKEPFLNRLEMNMPSKRAVVSRVREAKYAGDFRAVFGRRSLSPTDVRRAYDRIVAAIAAYERSTELNSFTAKHDYAMTLVGPPRMMTFTADERMGMMLFNGAAQCSVCHVNPMSGLPPSEASTIVPTEPILYSDYRFANLGIPKNWGSPFLTLSALFNPDGAEYIDHGLAADLPGGVAANPQFDGMFRTPSLRNVAHTAPYGHNGYFKTLKEIVHFYNTRDVPGAGWPEPEVADNLETATMGDLGLTPTQENQIIAFLLTLSDGWWAGQ